jgi:hypothetical protein
MRVGAEPWGPGTGTAGHRTGAFGGKHIVPSGLPIALGWARFEGATQLLIATLKE